MKELVMNATVEDKPQYPLNDKQRLAAQSLCEAASVFTEGYEEGQQFLADAEFVENIPVNSVKALCAAKIVLDRALKDNNVMHANAAFQVLVHFLQPALDQANTPEYKRSFRSSFKKKPVERSDDTFLWNGYVTGNDVKLGNVKQINDAVKAMKDAGFIVARETAKHQANFVMGENGANMRFEI